MIAYTLNHIFSYDVSITSPPEVIGVVPEGLRAHFYIAGGDVIGPRVHGKVRPVGGDWLTMRQDGVALVDARLTLETVDGALIYMAYSGVVDLGPDGYEKFLQGEPPPRGTPIRTVPRCYTSHPDYLWLNRLQCLGVGQVFVDFAGHSQVVYDIYAVE
jgi:hypothetical protein